MERLKFTLTSDQLELLLAFEGVKGLGHLAELMARDPSVVSRNLQRMAEDHPVLKKVKGRWEITPLGVQVNKQTQAYLMEQAKLMAGATIGKKAQPSLCSEDSVLIIINAQNGIFDATQEGRNNSAAEKNIARLLKHWREKKRQVVHVQHVSDNPQSMFFRQSTGCEFLTALTPEGRETVVEKTKSSAFSDTKLEATLAEAACSNIVLVGFTANECIDSTARDAAAKGFATLVASDATATFDLRESTGKLVRAERIHRLTMLNINAFYARVVNTSDLLG